MPKRFTATEKWKDGWFRGLRPAHKLAWLYMLDECDYAGILEFDLKLMCFQTGMRITTEEFHRVMSKRVIPVRDGKLFIPKFITFQYGELHPSQSVHKKVIDRLKHYGIYESFQQISEGDTTVVAEWAQSAPRDKDKEEEEDKEEDKDKAKEGKVRFGEFVMLTATQWESLKEKWGEDRAKRGVEILNRAIGSKGYKYKSHYHTMFTWVDKELTKEETGGANRQGNTGGRKIFTTADNLSLAAKADQIRGVGGNKP